MIYSHGYKQVVNEKREWKGLVDDEKTKKRKRKEDRILGSQDRKNKKDKEQILF